MTDPVSRTRCRPGDVGVSVTVRYPVTGSETVTFRITDRWGSCVRRLCRRSTGPAGEVAVRGEGS